MLTSPREGRPSSRRAVDGAHRLWPERAQPSPPRPRRRRCRHPLPPASIPCPAWCSTTRTRTGRSIPARTCACPTWCSRWAGARWRRTSRARSPSPTCPRARARPRSAPPAFPRLPRGPRAVPVRAPARGSAGARPRRAAHRRQQPERLSRLRGQHHRRRRLTRRARLPVGAAVAAARLLGTGRGRQRRHPLHPQQRRRGAHRGQPGRGAAGLRAHPVRHQRLEPRPPAATCTPASPSRTCAR